MLSLALSLSPGSRLSRAATALPLAPPAILLASGPGTTGSVLTATSGLWSEGTPPGQWHADGVPVSGQTGTSLTISPEINRRAIDYRETADGIVSKSNIIAFPDRYMLCATRNRVPSGALVTTAAATTHKCTKIVVATPSYPINDLRLHFSGFASNEGLAPQETIVPSGAMIIARVVVRIGATLHDLSFAGAPGVTIASAALGAWTDPLALSNAIAAESAIEIWTFYQNAAGETQVPVYRIQKHRGERIWGSTTLAGVETYLADPLAASTAALDVNYAGVTQPQYYGPDMMISKGWDGRPVALVACDSIGEARQEYSANADARGNMGWLHRWLDSSGGIGCIPHLMIGMPGASSARELTGSGSTIATRRWDVLDQVKTFNADSRLPFTTIINQMGQNDTDANYATWWARYSGLIGRIKSRYPGTRFICIPPLGRTASSDQWTTTANQRFTNGDAGFAGDGRYNAWPPVAGDNATGKWLLREDILANTGAFHDGFIDTFAAWSDMASPGKWPPIAWTTTTAAATGTSWTSVTINAAPPHLEDILDFGGTGIVIRSIVDNGNGTWTVGDVTVRTVDVPAGTTVRIRPTSDGIHPQPSSIAMMVSALSQTEKEKLRG